MMTRIIIENNNKHIVIRPIIHHVVIVISLPLLCWIILIIMTTMNTQQQTYSGIVVTAAITQEQQQHRHRRRRRGSMMTMMMIPNDDIIVTTATAFVQQHQQQQRQRNVISSLIHDSRIRKRQQRCYFTTKYYQKHNNLQVKQQRPTTFVLRQQADSLLYIEQENLLIERGIYEEELMKDNYQEIITPPLPPHLLVSPSQSKEKKNKRNDVNTKSSSGFGKSTSSTTTTSSASNSNNKKKKDSLQSSTSTSWMNDDIAKYYSDVLDSEGVVCIDNVLDPTLADELRDFIVNLRNDSYQKVYGQTQLQFQQKQIQQNGNVIVEPINDNDATNTFTTVITATTAKTNGNRMIQHLERYANVLLKHNRCDLKIPLMGNGDLNLQYNKNDIYNIHCDNTNIVELSFNYIYQNSYIMNIIRHAFAKYPIKSSASSITKSPVLYELSSLISDPGSNRQTIHPDNPIQTLKHDVPVLYTCFIALQDVTADMGPTVWLPKTNTKEYHEQFFDTNPNLQNQNNVNEDNNNESPKDRLLRTHTPTYLGTLKKGDCAIYDSRVLHCGSANIKVQDDNEDNSRIIFYFSIRHPDILYPGNPASIRSEIGKSYITIDELQSCITDAVSRIPSGEQPKQIQTQKQQRYQTQQSNINDIINPFPWNR